MRTIQLCAAPTVTGAGVVSYTIPRNCNILAILPAVCSRTAAPVAGVYALAELSTTNVNNTTVSGCEGVLANVRWSSNFTTSGGPSGSFGASVQGIKVACKAGDLLYLNVTIVGTLTLDISFLIFFDL